MASGTLFIGWGELVVGREQKALQVFQETLGYYAGLQQQGVVESVEPFLLEPHGGELGGFILIRGDRAKLSQLRDSQEFQRMTARASLVVQKFGVVTAYGGEELQRSMADFQQQLGELA